MEQNHELVFNFLKAASLRKLEYLLLGAWAVNIYSDPRASGDLNIWIKDSEENRLKLLQTFKDINILGIEALKDIELVAGSSEVYIGNGYFIDIMTDIKAFRQKHFDACYTHATDFMIKNIKIKVLGKDDLIKEKQTHARPIDLEDVSRLQEA